MKRAMAVFAASMALLASLAACGPGATPSVPISNPSVAPTDTTPPASNGTESPSSSLEGSPAGS